MRLISTGIATKFLIDSGFRRGTDIFKALALGAQGVLIGRPWVWALAGGGESGLRQLLAGWQRELAVTMMLAGVTRVQDIAAEHLDRGEIGAV